MKKKKFSLNRFVVVAGVIVFNIYLITTIVMQQFSIAQSKQELTQYTSNLEAEKEKSSELDMQMQQQNDPEYIEQMAREKLGLYKSNEKIFIDGSMR